MDNAGGKLMVGLDEIHDINWLMGTLEKITRRIVPVPKVGSGKYVYKPMDLIQVSAVDDEERGTMARIIVKGDHRKKERKICVFGGRKKEVCVKRVEGRGEGERQPLDEAIVGEYQKQLYKIWQKLLMDGSPTQLKIVTSKGKI